MPKLRCEGCGQDDHDRRGTGWRSVLGREDDDRVVAIVMCPACGFDLDLNTSTSVMGENDGHGD